MRYNREAQRRIYSLERGGLGEVEMWLERTTRDWDERLSRLAAEIAAFGEEDR